MRETYTDREREGVSKFKDLSLVPTNLCYSACDPMGKCIVSFVHSKVLQVKMLLYICNLENEENLIRRHFWCCLVGWWEGWACLFLFALALNSSRKYNVSAESIYITPLFPSPCSPPSLSSLFLSAHLLKSQPAKGKRQMTARYYSRSWAAVLLEVIKADFFFFSLAQPLHRGGGEKSTSPSGLARAFQPKQ